MGTHCSIFTLSNTPTSGGQKESQLYVTIYPEDSNRQQTFDLPEVNAVEELKLVFEKSSDFFGRITVYDLQLWGDIIN